MEILMHLVSRLQRAGTRKCTESARCDKFSMSIELVYIHLYMPAIGRSPVYPYPYNTSAHSRLLLYVVRCWVRCSSILLENAHIQEHY